MNVVIDTAAKKIVSAPMCYQAAARVGNARDIEVGKVVHSCCDESAVSSHEMKFGKLAPFA